MKAPTTNPSRTVPDAEPTSACFQHDWEGDEDLSTEIVMTVAEMTDTDETEVERLYDRIDPDCLDSIWATTDADQSESNGMLWFSLEECRVTVYQTGFVVVQGAT